MVVALPRGLNCTFCYSIITALPILFILGELGEIVRPGEKAQQNFHPRAFSPTQLTVPGSLRMNIILTHTGINYIAGLCLKKQSTKGEKKRHSRS